MTTMNEYLHERLAHYRAITPHPGTTCRRCGGLAEWREINEQERPTPGTEWCYCSACGQRMHGELSPWSEKAHADWFASRPFKALQLVWRNRRAYKRIKFDYELGRRRLLLDTTS